MSKFIAAAAVLCVLTTSAFAEGPLDYGMRNQAFVRALRDGVSDTPMPSDGPMGRGVAMLKQQAGDPGPIVLHVARVQRFQSQPRCGRVAFVMTQPSSHKVWPAINGQLNTCEDGNPPLMECSTMTVPVLVQAGKACPNGQAPHQTAEVQAAIDKAVAAGGKTGQDLAAEMMKVWRQARDKAATAAVTQKGKG